MADKAKYDLSGKVALVTGAGGRQGIGRAIAVRLAREGADVVVNDVSQRPHHDRDPQWGGVHQVVSEIEDLGRGALAVLADVSDSAQVDGMVTAALHSFGRIDILVNNAASGPGRDRVPLVDLDEDAWDMVQSVIVRGTFLCCRSVARHMIARGQGGKIIVMSSVTGKRGRPRYTAYAAAKSALIGFTRSLALELAPHRINVNAICPGMVETERSGQIAAALAAEGQSEEDYLRRMMEVQERENPLGRPGQPEDIANMAAFLASPQSDYVTGQSVNVSGGSWWD